MVDRDNVSKHRRARWRRKGVDPTLDLVIKPSFSAFGGISGLRRRREAEQYPRDILL